jgi:hypothetical protein
MDPVMVMGVPVSRADARAIERGLLAGRRLR